MNWREVLGWVENPNPLIHYKEYIQPNEDYYCTIFDNLGGGWSENLNDVTCNECKSSYYEDVLVQEHEKEVKRVGAEFYNFGWGQTDTGIASKTSQGILDSEIDLDTGEVIHTWDDYE